MLKVKLIENTKPDESVGNRHLNDTPGHVLLQETAENRKATSLL